MQHYLQMSSNMNSALGINRKQSVVICRIREPGNTAPFVDCKQHFIPSYPLIVQSLTNILRTYLFDILHNLFPVGKLAQVKSLPSDIVLKVSKQTAVGFPHMSAWEYIKKKCLHQFTLQIFFSDFHTVCPWCLKHEPQLHLSIFFFCCRYYSLALTCA